jgi:hypothetical protein
MLRRPWILNLLLVAGLLVAGSRLWSLWQAPLPDLPKPAAPARSQAESEVESGDEPEAKPEDFEVIAAKDLFSPARGVVPAVVAKAGELPPAQKPQPAPKVTLAGVVIVDGEIAAFLQEGSQDSRPRKVREGESFAGGKVTAIRPDGVTMLFASGEVSVPLRTPKDGGPSLPAATPAGRFVQPGRATAPVPAQVRPQQPLKPPMPGVPTYVPPDEEEPLPDEELFEEEGLEEGGEDEMEEEYFEEPSEEEAPEEQ